MAKRYTSTIDLRCGKEHTCVGCGAVYSYLFVRKVTGTAGTAAAAQQSARKAADKVLATSVDPRPCPNCGIVQPDMIAQRRRKGHWAVFWFSLIGLGILLIVRASYGMQADTAAWVLTGACAVAALAYAAADLKDLNRDLEGNRRDTAERITAGTMFAHAPGRTGPAAEEWAHPSRGVLHRLALLLLPVTVALAASPELFRMAKGWPLNADAYPPVIGPGDGTRVYMQEKITSIKGFWRGSPEVTLRPPGGEPIRANAATNQNDWGGTIYAKSSEKETTSTPWVRIEVPDDASLAGKTVDCEIQLDVKYPKLMGSSNFQTTADTLTRTVSLRLAPAGAGARYNSWWWTAELWAMALILACGMVLAGAASGLQRRANPTRILP